MALSVKLNVFEGPLDLLLHLIEKNKIDIYDIPIVEITDQYMEYLHSMEKEDLGIMSEFLVMAATLLDIKCKMLLPKEVNEEGEEEDPRAELVQKLLEYKMYKYMSYELRDRLGDAAGVYYRKQDLPEVLPEMYILLSLPFGEKTLLLLSLAPQYPLLTNAVSPSRPLFFVHRATDRPVYVARSCFYTWYIACYTVDRMPLCVPIIPVMGQESRLAAYVVHVPHL